MTGPFPVHDIQSLPSFGSVDAVATRDASTSDSDLPFFEVVPASTVASVNQLPIELLSEIFLYLCDASGHHAGWMTVLWVCVHWRRVAVATANLWTSIRNVSPGFVAMCLENSKLCPLNVTFVAPNKEIDISSVTDFIGYFDPHKQRIASLHLPNMPCHDLQAFLSLADLSTLTSLHTLHLRLSMRCATVQPDVSVSLEQCCNVSTLDIVHASITFDNPRMMNLVQLSLTSIQELPPINTLLSLIRHSPRLRDLHLTTVECPSLPRRSRRSSLIPEDCKPVFASSLRLITMDFVSPRYAKNILSMVICPSAEPRVRLSPSHQQVIGPAYLQSALPSNLRNLGSCAQVNGLWVDLDRETGFVSIRGFIHGDAKTTTVMGVLENNLSVFSLCVARRKDVRIAALHDGIVESLCHFLRSSRLGKQITLVILSAPCKQCHALQLVEELPALKTLKVVS